jgi:hypothetical protein
MADERLTQLARLLGLPRGAVDKQTAPQLVHDMTSTLAAALFEEAAASDDVVDVDSALDYLDARLEFLAPYIGAATADAVRKHANKRSSGWPERP